MTPGTHIAIVSRNASDALSGRFQGWELRDTLLVLIPGPSAFYVFLFRVPLQESTIAAQVLKTGTGGLNIDACRISSGVRQATAGIRTVSENKGWGVGQGGSGYIKGTGATFTNEGRWPSNLLLIHHSECVNEGTKRVKASAEGAGKLWSHYRDEKLDQAKAKKSNIAGVDGLEIIQTWNCHPSCPVRLLDEQGVVMGIHSAGSKRECVLTSKYQNTSYHAPITRQHNRFGDSGGASRFFPQFKNMPEMLDWIDQLIN